MKKITVPFFATNFFADSMDKYIFPLKGYVWSVFIVFVTLFAGIAISAIVEDKQLSNILSIPFFISCSLLILCILATKFFDEYLYEHIVIKSDCLVYVYSKFLSGNKAEYFQFDSKSKIVWSVKDTGALCDLNSLFLVNSEGERKVLIQNFRIHWLYSSRFDKFMQKLSELAGLEIEKEIGRNIGQDAGQAEGQWS